MCGQEVLAEDADAANAYDGTVGLIQDAHKFAAIIGEHVGEAPCSRSDRDGYRRSRGPKGKLAA